MLATNEPFGRSFQFRLGTSGDLSDYIVLHRVQWGEMEGVLIDASFEAVPKAGKAALSEPIWTQEEREALTSAVDRIEIREGGERIILDTGNMRAPMSVLNTCAEHLVAESGIDVEAHKTLSRRVAPTDFDEMEAEISRGYPETAKREKKHARVQVRIDVDDKGQATGCHAVPTFSHPEFDDSVCRLMTEKVSYDPALDAAGNPIPSYFMQTIRYGVFTVTQSMTLN